jgi:integrase/recombinase XerD
MRKERIELNKIKQDKTFQKGFEEFIIYCKSRNLRETTIRHYKNMMRHVIYKFFKPSTKIKTITPETIQQFILFLKTKTKENEVSIKTSIVTLRAILYYFMRLDYMETFKIHTIKVDKKVIETYTDAELRLLLEKPDIKKCTFLEYRNYVIVNFLMATGCRARTLCNMKIKDLDFENDLITYTWTKNRRQQVVPMSNTLKRVLLEYLQYREGKPDDYVFVNAYGGFLNIDILSHNIEKYNRKRGVMTTGVHRFRHTFAKKWILNGGDIFKLQKMLGHSSVSMVKQYVDMFTDDLQQDFNTYNPLEQLKSSDKNFIKMRKGD